MSKTAIFDKKNILIIGGAGFVGSHLCDELVKTAKVVCLDNFLTGDEDNISHLYQDPNFEFINHDIVEPIALEERPALANFKVEFQGIQEIYFLASPTSPKAYNANPIKTLLINSIGLKNALDMAVKYKAKLLYGSSPAVYGDKAGTDLIKEDFVGAVDHLGVRARYAEAVRFGETLVDNYRQKHDLDTKILRISNCYGPRMSLEDGRMIPEMIKSAVSNKPITIYGDEKSQGAYFYILDLVKILTNMMDSAEAGPLNAGSDWKVKMSEVAEKIVQISSSKSAIEYKPLESTMASQIYVNVASAKEKLGWFPIVLLDEGLKNTIDYLSAQRGVLEPETVEV